MVNKARKGTAEFLIDNNIPLLKINKNSFYINNKPLTSLYKRKIRKEGFMGYFVDTVMFGVVYRSGIYLETLKRNI